jgi:hypothetical protein
MNYRFAVRAAVVLGFCLVLSSVHLMAQTEPSPGSQTQSSTGDQTQFTTEKTRTGTGAQVQGAEKAQRVSQMLNLSPQQESQITAILENEAPKVQGIKNDPNLTADEKKKRLKGVHQQTDKLVKPILTPIQWKQWAQYRKTELADIR